MAIEHFHFVDAKKVKKWTPEDTTFGQLAAIVFDCEQIPIAADLDNPAALEGPQPEQPAAAGVAPQDDREDQRPERFNVGDKLDAMVTNIDQRARRIGLSIKALEIAEEKEAVEQYGSSDSGASLGDILGAALNRDEAADDNSDVKSDDGEKEKD